MIAASLIKAHASRTGYLSALCAPHRPLDSLGMAFPHSRRLGFNCSAGDVTRLSNSGIVSYSSLPKQDAVAEAHVRSCCSVAP